MFKFSFISDYVLSSWLRVILSVNLRLLASDDGGVSMEKLDVNVIAMF